MSDEQVRAVLTGLGVPTEAVEKMVVQAREVRARKRERMLAQKSQLKVGGIGVPFGREGVLTDFITPDWDDVMEFYPVWAERRKAANQDVWPIQPFMLEVCNQLERGKARPGRTRDDWMQRALQHFGLNWMTAWFEKYKGVGDE
jgi:hypothetical protein